MILAQKCTRFYDFKLRIFSAKIQISASKSSHQNQIFGQKLDFSRQKSWAFFSNLESIIDFLAQKFKYFATKWKENLRTLYNFYSKSTILARKFKYLLHFTISNYVSLALKFKLVLQKVLIKI